MRKILFILLLFPLTISAQTFFPVQNLYVKDAFRFGSFYFVKNADSLWLEKPLGTYICRLDTNIIGTGSTVYASDGVIKDGDTIKLTYDQQLITGSIVGYEEEINGQTRSASVLGTKDLIDNRPKLVLSTTGKLDSNNITLELDSATLKFINIDTTKTEPLSVMTESQVKREIAAAQRWTDISGGISYGNEVTVGSLSGTGNRNIGADSNGKLIELAAAPGVLQSVTVNLTASQIFNKNWVSVIPAQASGKMAIVQYMSVFYNYGTTTYTANEFFMGISYDAGSTTHQLTSSENVSTFLNTSSDGVVLVKVNPAILIPNNAAVYIRNSTSMTAPTGDGTFSVTIYYSIIDI